MHYKRAFWSTYCLSVIYLWLVLRLIEHLLQFLWMFLVSLCSSYSVLTTIKHIMSWNWRRHYFNQGNLYSQQVTVISHTWYLWSKSQQVFCASMTVSNSKYLKSEIAVIRHYNGLAQRTWITCMINCDSVLNSVSFLVYLAIYWWDINKLFLLNGTMYNSLSV